MAKKLIQILYVDDNKLDRELVRDALEKEHGGFKLFEAASGAEFEKMFIERDYDLILSDFHILGFEGFQVIDIVKEKDPHLPIILVTGTGSEEVAVEAMKRGAADYVLKSPSHIQRLPQSIHSVLEKQRLEVQRQLDRKALEESQRIYTNLFNNAEVGMFRTRLDGSEILQANDKFLEIFGWSSEEVVGKPSVIHWVDPNERQEMVKRLNLEGRVVDYECNLLNKKGEILDCITSLNLYADEGILDGSIRDVTDRKRAERKLAASEARYRGLVENSTTGITTVDTNGIFTFVNQALCEMTGYAEEEMLGKVFTEFLHPEDLPYMLEEFRNAERNLYVSPQLEFRISNKQGKSVYCYTKPTFLKENDDISGVSAIILDITKLKQAEHALRESETLKDAVISLSPIGISVHNSLGKLLLVNEAWKKIWGVSDEDYQKKLQEHIETFFFDEWDEYLGKYQEDVRRIYEKGGNLYLPELKIIQREQGKEKWISRYYYAILDDNNQVEQVVALTEDITERKQAELSAIKRAEEMAAIQETILDVTSKHRLSDLLSSLVERSVKLLNSEGGGLYLCDQERQEVRCVVSYKTPEDYTGVVLPYGSGAAGYVAKTGKPLIVDDYRTWSGRADVYTKNDPFRSVLSVPILWQGEVTGVLHSLRYTEGNHYNQEDLELLTVLANHAAYALENARLIDELQKELKEHSQAESALRASESRFRAILENIVDGYYEVDLKGNFTFFNPAYINMLGYDESEMMGMNYRQYMNPDMAKNVFERFNRVYRKGIPERAIDWQFIRKDGTPLPVETSVSLIKTADGSIEGFRGIVRDVSERKQAEKLIKESESKYHSLFNNVPDGIYSTSTDGRILAANPALVKMFGFESFEDFQKENASNLYIDPAEREEALRQVDELGEAHNLEVTFRRRDGSRMIAIENSRANIDLDGNIISYEGTLTDITERKLAEDALHESENRFRTTLENMRLIAIQLNSKGKLTYANPYFVELSGYSLEELLGKNWYSTFIPSAIKNKMKHRLHDAIFNGKLDYQHENPILLKDGSERLIRWNNSLINDADGTPIGITSVGEDITAEKEAENALRESEKRFRTTLENMELIAIQLNDEGRITYANPYFIELSGYSREELLGRDWSSTFIPEVIRGELNQYLHDSIFKGNIEYQHENPILLRNGSERLIRWNNSLMETKNGSSIGLTSIGEDITEKKAAEAAILRQLNELTVLQQVAQASAQAIDSEELISSVMTIVSESLYPDSCGVLLYDKEKEVLHPVRPFIGVTDEDLNRSEIISIPLGSGVTGRVAASLKPLYIPDTSKEKNYISINKEIHSELCVPIMIGERLLGVIDAESTKINAFNDNDERLLLTIAGTLATALEKLRLFEQTSRQLEFVQVLRKIDMSISSNLDLRPTIQIILEQVLKQLKVDAADILLLNPHSRLLVYHKGLGFRTNVLQYTLLPLGEGLAGKAALEKQVVHIPDLSLDQGVMAKEIRLANEDFVSYLSVPLIAKGMVKGVMEVFTRTPLYPGQEWLEQVEILARQAAIAIDNVSLYDDLQSSNQELMMAYDATIEGWSKALDLRDQETEGHTQRVVDTTLKIARKLNISDHELVHVRRGALLHDIGKMGIPDGILRKPGPLSEEEWDIMHKHPQYAFEMLAPIAYLKPALDIPYCHHEKWDGSGYPRSLKGELIPLAARIFAVVDVYDALTSDRPYRKSWTQEKAMDYIKEQSGKHFDPKVCEIFLDLMAEIK